MEALFSGILSSPSHVYAGLELVTACLSPLDYTPGEQASQPEDWRRKLMVSAVVPAMGHVVGMVKRLLLSASQSVLMVLRSALAHVAELSPGLAARILALLTTPVANEVRAVLDAKRHEGQVLAADTLLARKLYCLAALAQQMTCKSILLRATESVEGDGPSLLMALCDLSLLPGPCATTSLEVLYALVQVTDDRDLTVEETSVVSVVVHQLLGCLFHPDYSMASTIGGLRVLNAVAQFLPFGMTVIVDEMLELEARPWAAITAPEVLETEQPLSPAELKQEQTRLRELVLFLQLLALYPTAQMEAPPNKKQFFTFALTLNWPQKVGRLMAVAALEPLLPCLQADPELSDAAEDLQLLLRVLAGHDPRQLG